jgi:hypothetical protein
VPEYPAAVFLQPFVGHDIGYQGIQYGQLHFLPPDHIVPRVIFFDEQFQNPVVHNLCLIVSRDTKLMVKQDQDNDIRHPGG